MTTLGTLRHKESGREFKDVERVPNHARSYISVLLVPGSVGANSFPVDKWEFIPDEPPFVVPVKRSAIIQNPRGFRFILTDSGLWGALNDDNIGYEFPVELPADMRGWRVIFEGGDGS